MIQPLPAIRAYGRNFYTAFLLLLCSAAFAQSKPTPLAEFSSQLPEAKAHRLTQLVKELQPAVYMTQDQINVHGGAPVCVYTEQSAQYRLSENGFDKSAVELVSMVISSPATAIDLSQLSDFPSLDYLLLRLPSAQSAQNIHFTGDKPGLSIVYDLNVSY